MDSLDRINAEIDAIRAVRKKPLTPLYAERENAHRQVKAQVDGKGEGKVQ